MTRDHVSLRLPSETISRVRERAEAYGEPLTSTIERYLEEGLRRERHPLIAFVDGAMGRRPTLAGTGPDVWQVVEVFHASTGSIAQTAEYLSLPEMRVRAAVAYYADHPGEIDGWIRRNRDVLKKERDLADRVRALSRTPFTDSV